MTGDFYEIVLILFIEILEIANFWADSFPHSPFKLLQQILSTKKFNDFAVMLTRFVSRFFPVRRRTLLLRSLLVQPCILPLYENIKRPFSDIEMILKRIFKSSAFSSSEVFSSLNFLLGSSFNQFPSTIDNME